MSFDKLGLKPELLKAVAAQGYNKPTPIQAQAIPVILSGRDVMGGAQTGTGKTAAFALPILHRLADGRQKGRRPRCLVLTPTRELAAQVGESFITYGAHLPLKTMVIFGGVGINPQIEGLRRGTDVLVATPGRLLDHAGQQTLDLSAVEILVLDEADRMLDMGFIHDLRKVLKLLPAKRHNLLFSATYADEIRELADGLLHEPALIEVAARNTAAEKVEQVIHPVAVKAKRDLLAQLIVDEAWERALVFTRTKHGANRLADFLDKKGISAAAIHGNKSQTARTKALSSFKQGGLRILVATDIAARGLDIEQMPQVVNFDLPNVAEDYIHRIGRTGRAGAGGRAVSLVSADESKLLKPIERLLGRALPITEIAGFAADPEDAEKAAHKDFGRNRQGRGNRPPQRGTGAGAGRNGNRRRSASGNNTGGKDHHRII